MCNEFKANFTTPRFIQEWQPEVKKWIAYELFRENAIDTFFMYPLFSLTTPSTPQTPGESSPEII